MPRRFFFGSLLFGIETVCWAEVAQELNDFVEAVLTNVCAEMSALTPNIWPTTACETLWRR